jgi:hypothetical protein
MMFLAMACAATLQRTKLANSCESHRIASAGTSWLTFEGVRAWYFDHAKGGQRFIKHP